MVAAEEGALPPHKRSSPPHDYHGDEGRHGEQRKRERRPAGAAGGGTEAPLHLPHRRSSLGRQYSLVASARRPFVLQVRFIGSVLIGWVSRTCVEGEEAGGRTTVGHED